MANIITRCYGKPRRSGSVQELKVEDVHLKKANMAAPMSRGVFKPLKGQLTDAWMQDQRDFAAQQTCANANRYMFQTSVRDCFCLPS